MEQDMIVAGVGGQGILTIAQAISLAALRRGWCVKQSEVHGMSQRGGDVQSHLRIADHELYSDLVPRGRAGLVLAVEPLEALRYFEFLAEDGVVVTSSNPFANIANYPPIADLLERIARSGPHIIVDAEHWAMVAGSTRSSNIVMLGAASVLLALSQSDLDAALVEMFASKGSGVLQLNQRALKLGRAAAAAYRDGLDRGMQPVEIHEWLSHLSGDQLEAGGRPNGQRAAALPRDLTPDAARRVDDMLAGAVRDDRSRLHEHEVYGIVHAAGAISPPRHIFVARGQSVYADELAALGSARVVLKLVSVDVVHKTEAGAVVFVSSDATLVNSEIARLTSDAGDRGQSAAGVLVVEYIDQASSGLGSELFVGIRATREFGPVLAAGLGGADTEYLASRMRPGIAVAKALARETTAEQFFDLFTATAAYELLSGRARGHTRVVSDGTLLRCFRAFLAIARRCCVARSDGGPELAELEVNPFAMRHGRLVPLDGRGLIGLAARGVPSRPAESIRALLSPRSIAVMGVSSKRANFGRIIVNNIRDCGFPLEHLYIIKDQAEPIDSVRCVPSLAALPERVDLLVTATAATELPKIIDEIIATNQATSTILIPGGLGEKEGTQGLQQRLHASIVRARGAANRGPVFLGGNCMGVRSRPGRYDTFFIPEIKLNPRRSASPRRLALVSQSGAFIITRMSNLESLDPMLAVSVGNQIDITLSDMVSVVAERSDIDCIGVYAEGFNDLDGLAFVEAVESATRVGKIVVFYKAGRTSAGRSATAGHTASLAGDYDVCLAALSQAGAIVTDTFKEFEQLLELATTLHGKAINGLRIGAVSNAGYETVGMADAIVGARYRLEIANLSPGTRKQLDKALERAGLSALVNGRNPLDLTPMADDAAVECCVRVLLEADEVDAAVVAIVPMTPQLHTLAAEIGDPGSIAWRLQHLMHETKKPLVAVVDSGTPFDALVRALRDGGVPVFRTADQAIRSLGRYMCHRCAPAGCRESEMPGSVINAIEPTSRGENALAHAGNNGTSTREWT